jgi:hypothetical protein
LTKRSLVCFSQIFVRLIAVEGEYSHEVLDGFLSWFDSRMSSKYARLDVKDLGFVE